MTAAVDAEGNVIAEIPQFTRQVLEVKITPTRGITPYARAGAWPVWILTLLFAASAIVLSRRKK